MTNKTAYIGIVTSEGVSNLSTDDEKLITKFKDLGFRIEKVVWSNKEIDFNKFDYLFIRSTWDYHLRIDEFLKWLEEIQRDNICIYNGAEIIKWNMKKNYLKDLQLAGLNVVPTKILIKTENMITDGILENLWSEIVIKPAVSATAYKTYYLKEYDIVDLKKIINSYTDGESILIQKFLPEIKSKGEISFIFFNKVFSHAVLKTPKEGDFRVQKDFGGNTIEIDPPVELITQAQAFVNYLKDDLLYARVDCIESEGKLILMELELIEPELFFNYNSRAAENFYRAFQTINKK